MWLYTKLIMLSLLAGLGHGFLLQKLLDKAKASPINVLCVMEHCAKESAACVEDTDCRYNMECIMKCGMPGNQTCMNDCMNTFDDDVFDSFMKCMAQDNHCLTLSPPDPSFRCNPPQAALKKFSLSQLQGQWYIVMGLNPEYDCYPCQLSSYAPMPGSNNFTLTEHYDVTMLNGSIRHRGDQQQVAQFDVFTEGKLDYTSSMMGLTMYAQWQVIDYGADGNYAVMYYCGHMASNWWYEGSVVYSRHIVLSADDSQAIANVVRDKLGRDISDYCKPRTAGCSA